MIQGMPFVVPRRDAAGRGWDGQITGGKGACRPSDVMANDSVEDGRLAVATLRCGWKRMHLSAQALVTFPLVSGDFLGTAQLTAKAICVPGEDVGTGCSRTIV